MPIVMDTEVLRAIKENAAAMSRLITIIAAREVRSEWVDPEAAAMILGLKITRANNHRKQLNWLLRQGFLKQVQVGRPPVYFRSELEVVAKRIVSGEIGFVGRF